MARSPDPTAPVLVLVLDGVVTPTTVARLRARVRMLLTHARVQTITCDVRGVVRPDVATVDALARLSLDARRAGGTIRIRHVGTALWDLLVLADLTEVLAPGAEPDRGSGRRPPA